jgi:hypothetical protein
MKHNKYTELGHCIKNFFHNEISKTVYIFMLFFCEREREASIGLPVSLQTQLFRFRGIYRALMSASVQLT